MERGEASQPNALQGRPEATDKMNSGLGEKCTQADTVEQSLIDTVAAVPLASDPAASDPVELPVPSEEHSNDRPRVGRPKNAVKREKVVLYLEPENVTAMKMKAVQFRARYSDVVDALVKYHLDALTVAETDEIKKMTRSTD